MQTSLQDQELIERIGWLIRLRWLAAVGVAVGTAGANLLFGIPVAALPLYAISGVILLYNACFLGLYWYWRRHTSLGSSAYVVFAHVQIAADLVSLTFVLHFAGGIENPVLFYLLFHMIIASILLSSRAAYAHATLAVILVVTMASMEATGLVQHINLGLMESPHLYKKPAFFGAVLFALASTMYLAVYMATSITKRLREREKEIMDLSEELEGKTAALEKANEELRELEMAKSRYLRKVAHELRSPIAAVQSSLRVVMDGLTGELPPKAEEMIARAESRTWALLKLVNDLLTLSRAREVKLLERREPVSLRAVAERVAGLQSARASGKNVRLQVQFPTDLPPIIGDPEAVEQMLTNLTANAIKYTPEGGEVVLSGRRSNGGVELRVSDTGIGIPEEDIPSIFNEFFRARNAREYAKEGTGLGLSIVKSIVDGLGGAISVESTVGKGTTFIVSLPSAQSETDS
ncbi:MAG: sensor histidine kinase [Armatimonadota bacterium]